MPGKHAATIRANRGRAARNAAKIEALIRAGASQRDLARLYGVSQPAICQLLRRRRTKKEITERPGKHAAVISIADPKRTVRAGSSGESGSDS